jgi:ubiquinone/menaquinone biosynthesis C-methylase UbiE
VSQKLTLEQIREFWSQQAVQHGQSPSASWSDHHVIEMEIVQLLRYLEDGDEVLDVGCANGFSSAHFVMSKQVRVCGVDYVPEMIATAEARRNSLAPEARERLRFNVGDAMKLDFGDDQFDKVTVVRVIINLGEWANQVRAMQECCRVLKPGGLLLMSEATVQGWRRLNALRAEWGLTDIPMPAFNNYLDQDQVSEALTRQMELIEVSNFASTYFVGTRVLKPLLSRACNLNIEVSNPDMEWNRWCSQLPAGGDYGTQKLFVFRKR